MAKNPSAQPHPSSKPRPPARPWAACGLTLATQGLQPPVAGSAKNPTGHAIGTHASAAEAVAGGHTHEPLLSGTRGGWQGNGVAEPLHASPRGQGP